MSDPDLATNRTGPSRTGAHGVGANGVGANDEETAQRLRQALDALAAEVRTRPDAYQRALAEWRRRERRRRLVGLVLACLVFAVADLVGLWALNHGSAQRTTPGPVVFDAPAPAVPRAPLPGSP